MTVLIWILVVPCVLWAVVRLGGWERSIAVQLVSFTPYAAAGAWLPVLLALGTRRWTTAAVAVVAAIALTVAVLPRRFAAADRGPTAGVPLTVMTSNMLFGGADPATLVRLVREHDVAVLAVQEYTAEGRAALTAAGLDDLLPYLSDAAEPRASGSGLYSRFPLTEAGSRRNAGGFMQAYGTVTVPGAGEVVIESAHPRAPSELGLNSLWRTDLAAEPRPGATPRILLGDFNATLDHAPMRELVAAGYRDAAAVTGNGLAKTWPDKPDTRRLPGITIDHVLVDRRFGVRETSVHQIPNSDHRAIVAELVLPQQSSG